MSEELGLQTHERGTSAPDHPCFTALFDQFGDVTDTLYCPETINFDTGELRHDRWALHINYVKTEGKRRLKKHITLFIKYCPMCGEKLIADDSAAGQAQ